MIEKLICLFVGYLFGTFQTGYFLVSATTAAIPPAPPTPSESWGPALASRS